MSKFCLDCWNKIMGTKDRKEKYILSREPDFCEECQQWKPVIVRARKRCLLADWFFFPGK